MKINRLDEGKWFDVLTTNKEPRKKDGQISQTIFKRIMALIQI